MCELSREGDMRRFTHMEEWYLIQHIGQPLTLLFPVHAHSPQGVVQWFCTHLHLRYEWLFLEVLDGTRHLEVFREVILPVQAEHRFSLYTGLRIALQTDIDVRSCINQTLIQDGHLTSRIVYRIVGAFLQLDTARCDDHRTLGYVIGT